MQAREIRVRPNLMLNKYVDGVPYASVVVDISESGIMFETGIEPVRRSTAATLIEFVLEDGATPFWVEGDFVRRTDNNAEAFRFRRMRSSERSRLRSFISQHGAMPEIELRTFNC